MQLKTISFGLAAALLPIIAIIGLEYGLRAADVASAERTVFQALPGRADYVAFNPDYASRYFQGFRPGVAFTPFRDEKASGTFRVVALGGSSTAGFPYQFYNGFPTRLQEGLAARAPGQQIEVVNLGLTAVNSYTLWDLRDAVVATAPDAVVIYAGHNEYYGAFGAGSTVYALGNQIWLKRLTLRLKRTVLFTLLEHLLYGDAAEAAANESRTMMARVVREASIPFEGDLYQTGIDQFAANMDEVVTAFRHAGIPVYLATLTANLAGQPPLGDAPRARTAFAEGRRLLAAGDSASARTAFLEAKEWDDIRFRAPEAINAHIRSLGELPGVTLVDVQAAVRAASPGGLEGAQLFTDHLHPTFDGYDLVAETFADALHTHPLLQAAEEPIALAPSPLDPIERAHAELTIDRLKTGYPFDKAVTPEAEQRAVLALLRDRLAGGRATDSLAVEVLTLQRPMPAALHAALRTTRARRDSLAVLRLYRALLFWQPFNDALIRDAVTYGLENPRLDAWNGHLALHAAQRTGDVAHLNALAATSLRRNQLGTAQHILDVIEARDADEPVMLYNRARLFILQGDTLAARRYFTRYRQTSGNGQNR